MSGLWQNPAMVTSGTKILNPLNEFLVAMPRNTTSGCVMALTLRGFAKRAETADPSGALSWISCRGRGVDQHHAVFLRKTAPVVVASSAK